MQSRLLLQGSERRGIMIIRKADHSDFRYVEIWMWNVKV